MQKMNRFLRKLSRGGSFIAGVVSMAVLCLFIQGKSPDSYFEISKNLDIFASVFKELNTYYVDPIEPGKLVKTGVDAMLNDLDPYTNFITEADIEEYEFQTTGRYGGIGATMRKKDDHVIVGDVYEGSPAQKAGLRPGDVILRVDDHPVADKSISDVSVLLKGAPGTQVVLRVRDAYDGTEADRIVTRGEIELSSVPYAGLVGPGEQVAFVRLAQFTPGCGRLVRQALDSLKGVQPDMKAVVLDLRNNPGGLLDEAVNVCNIFIDRGQLVVSTKGKVKDWDKDFKTTGSVWDNKIPLAVLVNQSSASASEIVAGTVQDLDRGIVIGKRSYGKGLVQTTRPLGYNARLKLTTAKYYTPSGRCIQALDYTHRNADGSVGNIPDSLKETYKTKNGRKVLSGGGVDPDIEVVQEPISKLSITLYTKNYFFDYATRYAKSHSEIAPAGTFALTDADFNEFVKWLDGKDYAYKTQTEIIFDSLKSTAMREKYYDAAAAALDEVQVNISHDKKQDLLKHQEEVIRLLEHEIVSRYYFQKGRIQQSLKSDTELNKALELLNDSGKYFALLKPN